ncbi:hypothetical protein ACIP98_32605 [Streptomyces sp. NPDC088354]|uniref:hypothetical protein n=1 Tax=Streptomyces sp. NPDC088354 TaxID=3365856 RepID=UPI00381035E4
MTRMKKYVAAAVTAAAVTGVPTVAHALTPAQAPGKAAAHITAGATAHAVKAESARIVRPGQRVHAAAGVELWLTRDGKHWTTPDMPEGQFRSVVDGNIDPHEPSVELQAETVGDQFFLSGVYVAPDSAAKVEVVTDDGTVTGTVVRLPGHPGWGAWYATSPVPRPLPAPIGRYFHSVTVLDAADHPLATLTMP